jgi:hypothetical protein
VVEVARVDGKELGKECESIALEGLEGHWGKGSPGTHRGMEDAMTGNESEDYLKDANMSSIDYRTGDKSGCCSG